MTVKEHYDKHLGNFYTWYTGDFETNMNKFKSYCVDNQIYPTNSGIAIDLGAGNGIQSIALAELGYKVKAIDFNIQLINELKSNIEHHQVEVFIDDIRLINRYSEPKAEVVICCGDTLPHLESLSEIEKLIADISSALVPRGRFILSFRDYSMELEDTQRFIPVKSDEKRILTCFIEYFIDSLRVTDLLHEFENGIWVQKVSSYYKTRLTKNFVIELLEKYGFKIINYKTERGMISIIAQN
jgi:SAM-dependent methyltransferase